MKNPVLFLAVAALAASAHAAGDDSRGRSVPVRRISGGTHSTARPQGSAAAVSAPAPVSTFRSGKMSAPAPRRASGGLAPAAAPRSMGGRRADWSRGFRAPLPPAKNLRRRAEPAPAPGEEPAPQQAEEGPAPVPGALIRTQGLGFKTAPAEPARVHAIEAGDRIAADEGKVMALETNKGVHVGPKDKPPSATLGSATLGASGKTAITPNSPIETGGN